MKTETAHPFEIAGMGTGPYRFVGMVSIPSATLAEQNTDAYNNALRELPRDLIGGCGTCSNCGMAIMNICIVRDGQGRRYGVGIDCIAKIDDPALCDAAKVAVAKHQRAVRRQRNEVKRQERHRAFDGMFSTDPRAHYGETNLQLRERLNAEAVAALSERNALGARRGLILKPLADALRDGRGGFCDSIANDLARGVVPSGRGLAITLDILAKRAGRRNSAAYEAELNRVSDILQSI